MHHEIVQRAFKKIKDEQERKTEIRPNNTPTSEILEDILKQEYNVEFGAKSLRAIHKGRQTIKKPPILKALCHFIGYNSYEDYKNKNGKSIKDEIIEKDKKEDSIKQEEDTVLANKPSVFKNLNSFISKQIGVTILITFLLSSIIFYGFIKTKEQRWMIWQNDRYVEVSLDLKTHNIKNLKLYKEERIQFFRKIPLDCNTVFFNNNGKPQVWYGRSDNGNLELFTSFGLHPKTGKTLKPITRYMINKYICIE